MRPAERPHELFSLVKRPVGLAEHAMGLHTSRLIRDGGTLQIGIGEVGDAVAHALLLGAAVSDGTEDGQVVSGVGGQFNFVQQAFALQGARAILTLPATRQGARGLGSNIRWSYGHVTIPRHMRNVVVAEYGIADLRGKSDADTIAASAMASAAPPAATIPRLVPVLIRASAVDRSGPVTLRCTASLNGVQTDPALSAATNTPSARTGSAGAVATSASPMLAALSPQSTGKVGPRRTSIACAIRSPSRKPKKPRLDTKPMTVLDSPNSALNSAANRPKPMRAGPNPIAVAANPAAESF